MSTETESFDQTKPGALPPGWTAGVTGFGAPKWAVAADTSAPTPPHVLKQSGSGTFPWAVKKDVSLQDGFVETRFKSISGKEDQAGGIVWRWRNGRTYYVARANANENNVALYYTTLGIRTTIEYVDAPVPLNVWHTLRAEFSGGKIRVLFNCKLAIEADDDHIKGAGAVGVWTKADSVTVFDDFRHGDRWRGRHSARWTVDLESLHATRLKPLVGAILHQTLCRDVLLPRLLAGWSVPIFNLRKSSGIDKSASKHYLCYIYNSFCFH